MQDQTSRCRWFLVLRTAVIALGIVVWCVPLPWLAAAEQVAQLKARHVAGQTFLTWQEITPPLAESMPAAEVKKLQMQAKQDNKLRYRIYRAARPITAVQGLTPLAEVPPLSGWNAEHYGIYPDPKQQALRYVLEEGKAPIPSGTGVYVHNPPAAGPAYYAITAVIDGKEHTSLSSTNALQTPVQETLGQGIPVLQRQTPVQQFNYVDGATLYYYVRWEAPPNASVMGKPFEYMVAIPPNAPKPTPVGIHMHAWGGSLHSGYGWWFNAAKGAILLASNQAPYDWWTGYHERFWDALPSPTAASWQQGVVRPYTQTRLLAFVDWMATKWDIDLQRTFAAGLSMGGSGAPMLALRYPERIAWAVSWVGVHRPQHTPGFKDSYASVYGQPGWGVKFENGTPVWNHFDDVWYLRQSPALETGFITAANGKNDQAIGWPQAVEFLRALQETKRPHLFIWGQSGHGERALMPPADGKQNQQQTMAIDIRTTQSLPAFTRCSLDDPPGNGDPNDGAASGQVNLYLYWDTQDIVDRDDRWEMTIGLAQHAPQPQGTVDVTPRRRQKFISKPGEKFTWQNQTLGSNKVVQSGQVTADQWGLLTLEQLIVTKGKNRIKITK